MTREILFLIRFVLTAALIFYSKWDKLQGEIRLPVVLEDQCHREVPNIQLFYRPVRQMVYAILFNLHHHTFLADKQREQQNDKPETSNIFCNTTLFSCPFVNFVLLC